MPSTKTNFFSYIVLIYAKLLAGHPKIEQRAFIQAKSIGQGHSGIPQNYKH
jgi:hypothetical protein